VTKGEGRSGLQIQGHPFLIKPISIPELVAGIERICLRAQRPDDKALWRLAPEPKKA